MMDLRILRHVVAVAGERSFTRAASILGISQPGLSRSIADFERDLGEALFDRTADGVLPTAFGEPIIARAKTLLADAEFFRRELSERASGTVGSVAFGAGPLVAALCYGNLLSQLAVQQPQLQIDARLAAGPALADMLWAGEIEFAVFAEPLLPSRHGLEVEKVGELELAVLARSGHPLAGRSSLSLADFKPFPIATGNGQQDSDSQAAGGSLSAIPTSIRCDDFSVLRSLVISSDTIWLAASALAENSEDIVVLDGPTEGGNRIKLVQVSVASRRLSPAARIAANLTKNLLRQFRT